MQRGHVIKEVGGWEKRHETDFTQFVSIFTAEVVGVFDSFRIFPDDKTNSSSILSYLRAIAIYFSSTIYYTRA
jgi:hypothetical protein